MLDVATAMADLGYDSVRMRQVADESEVALGTLYAEFPSKNLLILEVMNEWMGQLVEAQLSAGIVGATPVERVESAIFGLLDRALVHPTRLRTCIQAFSMPDPLGVEPVEKLELAFGRILFLAIGDEVDLDRRVDATRVIGGVWMACFLAWMTERRDEQHMRDMLGSAFRASLG